MPKLCSATLLAPGGHKFYLLLLQLSSYVLRRRMEGDYPESADIIPPLAPFSVRGDPALAHLAVEALQAHNIRLCKR